MGVKMELCLFHSKLDDAVSTAHKILFDYDSYRTSCEVDSAAATTHKNSIMVPTVPTPCELGGPIAATHKAYELPMVPWYHTYKLQPLRVGRHRRHNARILFIGCGNRTRYLSLLHVGRDCR
jgi:hypothetical protein